MVMAWIATRPPGDTSRSRAWKYVGQNRISDRLDHLDRDHGVVEPVDFAVVLELDHAPGRTDRPRPPAAAASRCCSADSVMEWTCGAAGRGADAQFAPARADLEHAAARADACRVEQPVDLAVLRVRQVGPRRAASLSNSALEYVMVSSRNSREQVVGQVVVLGDVVARLRQAVVHRAGMAHHGQWPKPLQRRRNEVGDRVGEGREQAGQVVGAPTRPPCRTRRSRSGRSGRPGGPARRAGGSPWWAAWDRPHRRPSRPDTAAGAAGARRRGARSPSREPAGGAAERAARHPRHCGPAVGIRCRAEGFRRYGWSQLVDPLPLRRRVPAVPPEPAAATA